MPVPVAAVAEPPFSRTDFSSVAASRCGCNVDASVSSNSRARRENPAPPWLSLSLAEPICSPARALLAEAVLASKLTAYVSGSESPAACRPGAWPILQRGAVALEVACLARLDLGCLVFSLAGNRLAGCN